MKGQVTRSMAADLQAALESTPTTSQIAAKALNTLVAVPQEDIQLSARTALQFARLLNEARILLRHFDADRSFGSDIGDFERRCREQIGPIVEPL